MASRKPMRLPPLDVLRVKNVNRPTASPCIAIMSSVLSCWASTGHNTVGCAAVEESLRACMDAPQAPRKPQNTINYHLNRFSASLTGKKPGAKSKK